MLTILSIVFLVVVAAMIVDTLRSLQGESIRADYVRVLRAIRWWMVPLSLASLTACLTVGIWLVLHGPAWMQWGWWSALGGQGNVYLGQTGSQGLFWTVAGWVIPIGLVAAVPLLARQEEVLFRYGTETATILQTVTRSLLFGIVHLAAGVPVAAALALSIPGFVFAVVYRAAYRSPVVPVPVSAGPVDWETYTAMPKVGDRLAWLTAQMEQRDANGRARTNWDTMQMAARDRATDVAAAVHTVSNWCGLGLLFVILTLT